MGRLFGLILVCLDNAGILTSLYFEEHQYVQLEPEGITIG